MSARLGSCSPILPDLQLDLVVGDEALVEDRDGEAGEQHEEQQERHAQHPVLDGLAKPLFCRPMVQPANLTVAVVPQMAIDKNRSMTLIATMDVRTARPTATPTPAGPPVAL